MPTGAIPADLAAAVAVGGEMGQRFAAYDWSSHPLGPLDTWPPERRATVAVALSSRFPIVLWFDPDELFLVYNDAYIPVLGEKHPGALGAPGREVWWDIWEPISPMLAGVLTTGEATWSADLMLPVVTAGAPRERYFTFGYSPIVDGDGRVEGVFSALTETTEQVLGERRLHTLNTLAAALIETRTPDDVVRATVDACTGSHLDLPFVAVYVDGPDDTPGRLSGATPPAAELLPESLAGLVPTDGDAPQGPYIVPDVVSVLPDLPTVFGDNCPTRALVLRTAAARRDAATGSLVIGLNPHRPLDDQYRGFCRLLADQVAAAFATADSYEKERRRADALAELDRAKTAFLTNVSHEFRTPLTLLLGPLVDAIDGAADRPVQLHRLETAHRNAQRLMRLVNTLLDFFRTEAGRASATLVTTDLGALTQHIASSFTELCQRAGLRLVLRCQPVLADVDTAMWETIVLNLLSNAVKFTLSGSITVEVTTRGAGGGRFRVTDTGRGIADEDKDRLFERFYRAANTRGRSVEGTGIGLALVHGLLELHGGTIDIDSEVDVGTTVTIDLPPATERPTSGPATPETDDLYVAEALQWLDPGPAEPVVAGDSDRHLVLIADDNADMRRHLDGILSRRWRTVVFADGEAALRGARRYRPDLVVTDVMMPALDGFGLAAAIRADPHLATTPVVMLSARAGIEAANDGYAGGADDYLAKPFTSQELLNRVAARLDGVSRERTSREHEAEDSRREAALAELEAALSAAASTAEAMDALLASPILAPLGATSAAIGTQTASHVRIDYTGEFRAELRDRYHLAALDAPLPLADVIETGRPLVMPDTMLADARYLPVTRDIASDVRAIVAYPLRDSGRTVGAIAFMWPAPRDFNAAELDLLADIAVLAGAAIDRVRAVEREHRIAIDFQDQLLDLNRTSAAAVVGAVYEPAGEAMRVGGDWYLVTPLDEPGRIAVCVGDVVGHGLPAATVMSKLRSAVAATALTTPDPDAVLDAVDRYAAAVPGAACATVAYAVIDGAAGTIAYACAGHPYPLLVTPARDVRYLEDGRRPPVTALSPTASTATGHAVLPPGALVLLYTDGLIERPGESLTDGFERLAAAAADCAALPAGTACAELVRRMAPAGGYRDDVVLLALRAAGVTATSFVTVVPAHTAQCRQVRHRLHEWLAGMDLDEQREHDILLAVDEALVNAIEHGSDLEPRRTVSLEVFADGNTISATVGDTGQWSTDSSASRRIAGRGRGLTLMHGLSDTVDIQRTTRGTQVTMRFARAHQPSPTTGVTL